MSDFNMNQEADFDRVSRYLGAEPFARLRDKTVAIVGAGSGGGFAALALAMSGVGGFVLIDDDLLESKNVVRHVADLRDVGRPKAEAVADLIRARNPNTRVQAIVGRFEDHLDAIADVDLVVVGVDTEPPKFAINEQCRALGLAAVYAGVYERGEGGDVVIIRPGDGGPCYACWAQNLRDDGVDQASHTPLDYGQARPDGTIQAEPSLWLHVTRIAGIQADMALNELLIGTAAYRALPANTIIAANVEMEIFAGQTVPPYGAEWIAIRRDPYCLVCGGAGNSAANADIISLDQVLGKQGRQAND